MKKIHSGAWCAAVAAAWCAFPATAAHAQQRVSPAQPPREQTPLTTFPSQIPLPAFAALRGSLKADKKTLKAGETVTFTYSVTNTSKTAPQTVRFSSGQRFDITVSAKGSVVWQISQTMRYLMSLGSVTFAPGETKTLSGLWKPEPIMLKPGASYTATAYLTAMGTGQTGTASRPASAILTLSAPK